MGCNGCGDSPRIVGDRPLARVKSGPAATTMIIVTEDVQGLVGHVSGREYGDHDRGSIFAIDSQDYSHERRWVRVTAETMRMSWGV